MKKLTVYTNIGKFKLEFEELNGKIKSDYDNEELTEEGCYYWNNSEPFCPPFNGWITLSKEKNIHGAYPVLEEHTPFDVHIKGIYDAKS